MSESEFSKHCAIENGVLSASANSPGVSAETATAIFNWANENESFHSLLIKGSSEYKEPYYSTVHPWAEGLSGSNINCLRSFKIDEGTTMNRQFGNYVGDITAILKNNVDLTLLYISGAFRCSNYSHTSLESIYIANCFLDSDDLHVFSKANLPKLKTIAVYNGDAELSNAEFNTKLVESLSNIAAEKLSEIQLIDWGSCDDFLAKMCNENIMAQLTLLHVDGFEFGGDPEESVEFLLSNAEVLGKIKTLRIPFKGFMEDEIAQLLARLPGLENSRPTDGKSLNPF